VDPARGSWPVGALPEGPSTDPWRQVIHAVVAARRLESWALWAEISMIGRLISAWRSAPPVSNELPVDDRCDDADPALTARLNREILRVQRSVRGSWSGAAAELAPALASAEISLACGLSRMLSDRHVEAAEALIVQARLPRLRRLLRSGWVDRYKLTTFIAETSHLDAVVANAVERLVLGDIDPDDPDESAFVDVLADPARPGMGLPVIARMTVPALRDAIRGAIDTLQAEAAERRARRFRAERRVRCEATRDGTATLTAELAVEAAAAVWNALTLAAKAAQAAGDPRSLDQLRADELVARATGTRRRPPSPDDDPELHDPDDTFPSGRSNDFPSGRSNDANGDGTAANVASDDDRPLAGAASAKRAGRPLSVSLTLPLNSYLGLANDPGRLDGYGPVAAGLARQIIRETIRSEPAGITAITWRCVIVDDVHRTVVGVGAPITVPRHDPPPRLAELTRTMAPMCRFPGCRIRAGDCDLDHRIPYRPDDPRGDRGGGVTCSCNVQPLCRSHHRLKTAGLIDVRVLTGADGDEIPGTLEWTTRTGLRYRQAPTPATPASVDLDDPEVATAVAHAAVSNAREAASEAELARRTAVRVTSDHRRVSLEDHDREDRAWLASMADYTRHRIRQAADRAARDRDCGVDPPF